MSSAAADTEVAIVGGGPAGAALAIRLAAAGRDVTLFERLSRPRWRACGVYSSPLTRRRLRALGIDEPSLSRLLTPISAMVVATIDGRARCRLEYPAPDHACGVDRVRLEKLLLKRARAAGARVLEGAVVRQVDLGSDVSGLLVSQADGPSRWKARVVVGADGPTSIVARAAGVNLATRRYRRAAITGHRADTESARDGGAAEALMVVGAGWYLGIAPVPGNRVNLGLVMSEPRLRRALARTSVEAVMNDALGAGVGVPNRLRGAPSTDRLETQVPLVHRVRRASGKGFALIGDAAGFIDPISGEGLHRALCSAEMAACAIGADLAGDRTALADYDRRLRARFRGKDVVSWLLQLFLHQPHAAHYALARLDRRLPARRTFARGMADLAPASGLVDPRFVARVLVP